MWREVFDFSHVPLLMWGVLVAMLVAAVLLLTGGRQSRKTTKSPKFRIDTWVKCGAWNDGYGDALSGRPPKPAHESPDLVQSYNIGFEQGRKDKLAESCGKH